VNKDVLRLFGHPLHASMVHFPLGLLGSAPLWDGLGLAGVPGPWWAIGFWVVSAGLAMALVAAAIGLVDLLRAVEGRARAVGVWHLFAGVGAVSVFGLAWLLRDGMEPAAGRRVVVLVLDVVGFALISVTGWLGGELVFRHGIGRRDTPPVP
jgi:uncharacterized membrane protein